MILKWGWDDRNSFLWLKDSFNDRSNCLEHGHLCARQGVMLNDETKVWLCWRVDTTPHLQLLGRSACQWWLPDLNQGNFHKFKVEDTTKESSGLTCLYVSAANYNIAFAHNWNLCAWLVKKALIWSLPSWLSGNVNFFPHFTLVHYKIYTNWRPKLTSQTHQHTPQLPRWFYP